MSMTSEKWQAFETLISSRLGKPEVHRPGVMVYRDDSAKALAKLPKEIAALTVTSPPYNIGKEYESVRDVKDYIDWLQTWIEQVWRVTSPAGAFWLNLGYLSIPNKARAIPIPYLLWEKVPFFLIQEVVWTYGAGVAARRSFSPRNEKFLWYVKDPNAYTFNLDDVRDPNVKYPHQKKNGKLKCNPLGKNPTDVWDFPKVTSGTDRASAERTPHPAQFPVAVVDRIVRACSNPGDLIVDPFLGSGTVAEVALSTGRFVLGFEIESKYFPIIKRRVDNYIEWRRGSDAQVALFEAKERKELASLD